MKNLLLAGVAAGAIAMAGAAQAADLRMPVKAPVAAPPAFSWSGCYVGAHWGWGWGKRKGQGFSSGSPGTWGSFSGNDISGPLFGGQLGCNYQWPGSNFVIGVEGSYSAADIHGFGTTGLPNLNGRVDSKVDGLASVTGRLGWNGWDPMVLFYVKGGWAWEHERHIIEPCCGDRYFNKFSRDGWVIGGGVEWAFSFAPRWSAFAEYQHYDFGNKTVCLDACTDAFSVRLNKSTIDTVKIGVNYKFLNPF